MELCLSACQGLVRWLLSVPPPHDHQAPYVIETDTLLHCVPQRKICQCIVINGCVFLGSLWWVQYHCELQHPTYLRLLTYVCLLTFTYLRLLAYVYLLTFACSRLLTYFTYLPLLTYVCLLTFCPMSGSGKSLDEFVNLT